MLIYFVGPIALLLVDGLSENYLRPEKRGLEYLFIALSGFILCGGYMTGSDWRGYELLYNSITMNTVTDASREWLFYLYALAFRFMGVRFFDFLIFTKVVIFLEVISFLIKFSKNDLFSLFFFLTYSALALFLFVDNPLRFMIAFGIVLKALDYALNRGPMRFLITVLIACLFHISAIVVLPAYFIRHIKASKSFLILAYSVFFFGFSTNMLLLFLKWLSIYVPSLAIILHSYILLSKAADNPAISIGSLFNYSLFIIIVLSKEKIENELYGRELFALTITYFVFFKIGLVLATGFRLALYFMPCLIISLSIVLRTSHGLYRYAKLATVLYLVFSLYQNVYNSWTYYPYSNYFWQEGLDESDFVYRSNYNKEKYRERFGKYPDDTGYLKLKDLNDGDW